VEDVGLLISERDAREGVQDEELALAARSDRAAFGILYRRHRLSVYRFLRARTASDDDAAELTAVTFERALVAMPRYRTEGSGVLAWLLRIARNASVDAARRAARRAHPPDLDGVEASGPERVVLERERRRALLDAVRRLPEPQREAIQLRYAARLTAREIGEVLGRSEEATQKLLTRALATIRETYRADD
jgi:RNA polymerase sigma-70 factor (ECF subfamily)